MNFRLVTSSSLRAVFLLTPAIFFVVGPLMVAQESILYSFTTPSSDGQQPNSGLISDGKGNFYGTTEYGGSVGAPYGFDGTVFELSPASGGGWTEKVLYSFGVVSGDGVQPLANLVFDAKGNLYGTTMSGGANNDGTVFELSPGTGGIWTEKILHSFGAYAGDGNSPRRGSLIFDAKGNLYGTTFNGGANGAAPGDGAVFELSPGTGGVWTEKVIYSLGANSADAMHPSGGLVFSRAGNLYGVTVQGGAYNYGSVYELSSGSGGVWSEKVLHSFDVNGVDGASPIPCVIMDAEGNLYGTTQQGGNYGNGNHLGALYELSPSAGGTWTEQILYNFIGGYPNSDGATPVAGLIFDAAGNLYGTTSGGGPGIASDGTVFELVRGAGGWTERQIYAFTAAASDGHFPYGGVIFDAAGNLYGTTPSGGANSAGQYGTVYKIAGVATASPRFSPVGGAYSATQSVKITDATAGTTIYYTINGGASPRKYTAPLNVSASETITAYAISATLPQSQPASANYQIGTTAATPWFSPAGGTYTVAQSVTIMDAAPKATLYYTTDGTTPTTSSPRYSGPISVTASKTVKALAVAIGYTNSAVASVKYSITHVTPPTEKVLYNFGATTSDGDVPFASLVRDSKGNLYGTTKFGGPHQITYGNQSVTAGTAFELTLGTGGAWTRKILHSFGATGSDGALPVAGMVLDAQGNLYGTTLAGGAHGLGTVFELSPGTGGTWTEKILYSFGVSLADGKIPEASVVFDAAGNLYGTTSVGGTSDTTFGGGFGTVYELSLGTGGTWKEKTLYNFSYLSQTDGYFPESGLVFDASGNLYGTTASGGAGQDLEGGGTVFELSPSGNGWTEKILYNFGGGAPQGYQILGGVVLDGAGNVFGVATSGGNGFGLDGTVFELSPAGSAWNFQLLHSFGAYEGDGVSPTAGLVFDAAGNLYGTSYKGGANGYGAVFEMLPQTGGGWIEYVVHSFNLSTTDGANPSATLIVDGGGNLYGTTAYGGSLGDGNSGQVGGTVFEIVASVTSGGPTVTLSATSVAFGGIGKNETTPAKAITLTNTGTSALTISSIAITGTNPGDFAETNTCGSSVAAGASCKISVTFTPAATGARSATVSISDNATGSPQTITLRGTGSTAKLSPLALAFGSVATNTTTAAKTVTLTNEGASALTISSIAIVGTDPGDFAQTHTCGSSLAASASCTIHVTFTPAALGARSAALSVTDNAAGSPQRVTLAGTGK